jgi:hypothetical protein
LTRLAYAIDATRLARHECDVPKLVLTRDSPRVWSPWLVSPRVSETSESRANSSRPTSLSRPGSEESSSLSWKEIKSVRTAIPLLQKLSSLVTTLNITVSRLDSSNQGSHRHRPSGQSRRPSHTSSVATSIAEDEQPPAPPNLKQPSPPPPSQSPAVTGTDPSPTADATKRWPWVDTNHIK